MPLQDDPQICGDLLLYRRIPHTLGDVEWIEDKPRPTSRNFKDKNDQLSGNIASETTPAAVLSGHEGFGLVQFTAGQARQILGDSILICRDEIEPANGHVLICGNVKNGPAKRFTKVVQWVHSHWPMNLETFPFLSHWATGTLAVAQSIYDAREFARLPELAAALRACGCTNLEVLAHCEHPQPHSHNCWVVDLILQK